MSDAQQSPIQEAISIITIAAILLGVGCYVAAINNVPILGRALFWVATVVYQYVPGLKSLKGPQVPMLVAAATVGGVFFMFTLPFANLIARWFSASQLASLERQTATLKRNRARIVAKRRARDSFDVS